LCCAPDRTETLNRDSNLGLTASIRDLMDAEIDPAADFLWASVASVSSEAGLEDRQPRTTDDWAEARRKAITLVEATNLLVMSGRRVSTAYVPARGLGELDSTEVQKRIDAAPGAFKALAQVLRESSLKALTAIDARNPAELLEAGGAIDAACEACHVTFWYPEQPVTRHKR
jgi:cytochrome c556